ncbi:MAG: proline dehydrogenase family protein [Acidimicrobiia bacterium]|nr:proline dehydrogenase family protein [Acidimicrobiia bacterium]
MMRSAFLAVAGHRYTKRLITETAAGRAVADRFIAGDGLDDAVSTARQLNEQGMSVSLDHLGEHVTHIDEATTATKSYLACLEAIADEGLDANISVKLTQLGMGMDDDVAAGNLDQLASAAVAAGTSVTVDMEESTYTTATIDLYERVQAVHGNLGIAVQTYLTRTTADLDRLMALGGHIRLCKGAYAEPADVAYQTSDDVNRSFDRLAATLMSADGVTPAIATHDDARIAAVLDHASDRTAPWEFQMLYGVRRDRQRALVAQGHAMRIYVPYGDAWYPYFSRRLAERPANLTFFARALAGG